MYEALKKLIDKKFYATAEEVQERLDTFYLVNPPRLSKEHYMELTELVSKTYAE